MSSNPALAGTPTLLGSLPTGLRDDLIEAFDEIVRNFAQSRWEPSELNGGKLCEAAYTIIKGFAEGSYPARSSKPSNMVDACKALETAGPNVPRSFRIQVPRVIVAMYEIRNNRGVGHAGGDVDPNHMDALVVLAMGKWIVEELIRVLHQTDTATAQAAVEALATRTIPIIWATRDVKRVLDPSIRMKQQVLLLLYSETKPVSEQDLLRWTEHSNGSVFRRDVLKTAHKERLIDYDQASGAVVITPRGIAYVDDNLPTTITGATEAASRIPSRKRRRKSA